MCGIMCYIGTGGEAAKAVVEGLGRLEHRGYDSVGIMRLLEGRADLARLSQAEQPSFRASDLVSVMEDFHMPCNIAIGHNRWATFGKVTEHNAHPHHDEAGRIFIVHNGNVENLADVERGAGHWKRYSETDTEAIANLIARFCHAGKGLPDAVRLAMNVIEGANVIAVFSLDNPSEVVLANKGGTILLGRNCSANLVVSDPSAFEPFAVNEKLALGDGEMAVMDAKSWRILPLRIKDEAERAELPFRSRKSFTTCMEEEIFFQPESFRSTLRGRLDEERGIAHCDCFLNEAETLRNADCFHFVACGTAYFACRYAELLLARLGIAARSWIASEYLSEMPVIGRNDVFFFVSQSGETADSLQVLAEMRRKGHACLGIVNVVGSRIWRETRNGIGIRAGIERGVASTKAFTSQLASIDILAIFLARQRNLNLVSGQEMIKDIIKLPAQIGSVLKSAGKIKAVAEECLSFERFFFLGRHYSYVTAQEGALKLKEISYRFAEAYPLGEMKHGPLALVDRDFCSVVIVPEGLGFKQSLVNIQEIKARGGCVLAVANKSSDIPGADYRIDIPRCPDYLSPILAVIPLQLFALYTAQALGLDPDRPRNLAKTVTVS